MCPYMQCDVPLDFLTISSIIIEMSPKQLHLFGTKIDKGKKLQREGIVVPIDTTILLVVVIILLFIIAFSWGVERGRRLTLKDLSIEANSEEKNIVAKNELDHETIKEVKEKEAEKIEETKEENKIVEAKNPLYRIQVASFRKLSSANQEAEKLRKKGYPVKIKEKGKYSVVYAGKFENKKEAKEDLKKLKKIYKDCILRRL
ncbi:MAG: SPOR domain-containing protein [Candidatus Omnitrophica bacterium]|nr:SPOR domain-containing protein [Candidatus Omnitrophota bacterium]MCF7894294.1 SPOR domain-containing protein [Candidatus Omnitrophota bacterium]